MLSLDTRTYDHLDIDALREALGIQLPLVERLGTLRAALMGMHSYCFLVTNNSAHIDRIITEVKPLDFAENRALLRLIEKAAALRSNGNNRDCWRSVYRAEASGLLLMAWHADGASSADPVQFLKSYQLYSCAEILGNPDQPEFFSTQQLSSLIDRDNLQPEVLFTQQFIARLRKPELIARELERHYSAIR